MKVNPTVEFRVELIKNTELWLKKSSDDALDPNECRPTNEYNDGSGVDKYLA